MKIGCLAKFLVISTLVLAVGFYIVMNRFNDLILEPSIRYLINMSLGESVTKFKELPSSAGKQKIEFLLESFTREALKLKTINLKEVNVLGDSLRVIIIDKNIDSLEAKNFEQTIKKVLENER